MSWNMKFNNSCILGMRSLSFQIYWICVIVKLINCGVRFSLYIAAFDLKTKLLNKMIKGHEKPKQTESGITQKSSMILYLSKEVHLHQSWNYSRKLYLEFFYLQLCFSQHQSVKSVIWFCFKDYLTIATSVNFRKRKGFNPYFHIILRRNSFFLRVILTTIVNLKMNKSS